MGVTAGDLACSSACGNIEMCQILVSVFEACSYFKVFLKINALPIAF